MKVAYISGAYQAPTVNGIYENILKAQKVALKYWKLGYAVICPHANTIMINGDYDAELFLAGDLEILKRLVPGDVLIQMPSWKSSSGAKDEYKTALDNGLEIIEE